MRKESKYFVFWEVNILCHENFVVMITTIANILVKIEHDEKMYVRIYACIYVD